MYTINMIVQVLFDDKKNKCDLNLGVPPLNGWNIVNTVLKHQLINQSTNQDVIMCRSRDGSG